MAFTTADRNATIDRGPAELPADRPDSDPLPGRPAATTHAALLLPVAACCGVLDQLATMPGAPAVANLGRYWAFFVDRRSLAELFESLTDMPSRTEGAGYWGSSADLATMFVDGELFWILPPREDAPHSPAASAVAAAIQFAARAQGTHGRIAA